MHGSRLTCMTFYLKVLIWQNGSQWVSIECGGSPDSGFVQMISRVLRKMFTNKYFANVPLQNCESAILGMMDTGVKHSQNFGSKGNVCPVQVSLKEQFLWPRKWILDGQVEKWKLVHLTSVTLTRCYLQTGNSFVPETEKSESWPPHHDDSGKVAYKHQLHSGSHPTLTTVYNEDNNGSFNYVTQFRHMENNGQHANN